MSNDTKLSQIAEELLRVTRLLKEIISELPAKDKEKLGTKLQKAE